MLWGSPQGKALCISLEAIALEYLRLKPHHWDVSPQGYWGLSLKYSKDINGIGTFVGF